MIKLYKKENDSLFYAECWINDKMATVHIGKVGDTGQSEEFAVTDEMTFMSDFQRKYEDKGYLPFPKNEQFWVVLQWPIKKLSDSSYYRGENATEIINEDLGWLGLGNTDGFDMGKTGNPKEEFALSTFCVVVDKNILIKYVIDTLSKKLDCSRLKIASKLYYDDEYKLDYCKKPKENWFFL